MNSYLMHPTSFWYTYSDKKGREIEGGEREREREREGGRDMMNANQAQGFDVVHVNTYTESH